jgi:translation elongation factor EF-4
MNYTAYDLRKIDVLVKQEELQAIKGIVADQKAYLKVRRTHLYP